MRLALVAAIGLVLLGPGCRKRPEGGAPEPQGAAPPVKILYPSAPGSFVNLVAKLRPSVVHLATTAPVKGGPADFLPALGPASMPTTEGALHSLGTGFIVDEAGTILTNAHLVAKASEIHVLLDDETRAQATIVGQDAATDVAALKIEPPAGEKLTPARLGDSDQIQVGEWVVALGNPFGRGVTATAGVVSARERRGGLVGQPTAQLFLQTDAAINPSNSGGPLVNTLGEVVGIGTALEREAGGPGFAVPINVARKILPMLKREGKVVRVWVGIYMEKVPAERARELGLKRAMGALVTGVVPRGPAERAGLRAGDVILSFDGKDVLSADELPWLASLSGVDRQVPVKVWRGAKTLSFTLRTERMPE